MRLPKELRPSSAGAGRPATVVPDHFTSFSGRLRHAGLASRRVLGFRTRGRTVIPVADSLERQRGDG